MIKNNGINTLADLKQDQKNARKHNPRNIGMIVEAINEVGVARSGVIDEDGNILAGNGTFEALLEAGIKKIKVVEASGKEWVVVKRSGMSDKQKKKLALYDNRTADLAEWDGHNLKFLEAEFDGILDSVFTDLELKDIFSDIDDEIGEIEGEDDVPEKTWSNFTKEGDLYQVGEHRLLCGDSTAKDAVDRLMDGQKADMVFTDPPYGLGGYGGRKNMDLKGDDGSEEDITRFYRAIPDVAETYIWGRVENYRHIGFKPRDVIVWKKNNFGLGRGYRGQYEVCFYKGKFNGSDSDVWEVSRDVDYKHPTQKPVELACRAITNSNGKNILDLFGGSGSTMIACEKLNRKCYMMELDPQYCDVIIHRYRKLFPDKKIFYQLANSSKWHERAWI